MRERIKYYHMHLNDAYALHQHIYALLVLFQQPLFSVGVASVGTDACIWCENESGQRLMELVLSYHTPEYQVKSTRLITGLE